MKEQKLSEEESEIEILNEACKEISLKNKLTEELKAKLQKKLPKTFDEALQLVYAKRVKKYIFKPSCRVLWVVSGRKDEYQVIPEANFCSCNDFYFRVVGGKKKLCYHLIAQKIAEALKIYEEKKLTNGEYEKMMEKWRGKIKKAVC
jgi:predicted nucleic acid-binding Zn finger protein